MEEVKKNKEAPKKKWDRRTAGFFMEERIPIVEKSFTIAETIALIQKNIRGYEKIDLRLKKVGAIIDRQEDSL